MASYVGKFGTQLWSSYTRSVETRPVLTKSFTSFTGFVLGDTIAQLATSGNERFDYWRTARFAAFGFFIHAPGCHFFYQALDAVIFPSAAKSTKAVLAKMLIDQTIWTPISLVVFYSAFKTMEGRRDQIQQTLREKFFPTLLAGYAVWPLAHVVNFRFIPTSQRVLYINAVQVGWNVVLSKIATKKSPEKEKNECQQDIEIGRENEIVRDEGSSRRR
jgi:protein Mpv17